MLINIPEQKNCAKCDFCDSEFGLCTLKTAIENRSYSAADYTNDWSAEESRPDWCPFKHGVKIKPDHYDKEELFDDQAYWFTYCSCPVCDEDLYYTPDGINKKADKCPQCGVDLDWSDVF